MSVESHGLGAVDAAAGRLLAPVPSLAVRVEVGHEGSHPRRQGSRTRRVVAVVPCHNRVRDLELLLGDLARIEMGDELGAEAPTGGPVGGTGTKLRIVAVDNASQPALRESCARLGEAVGTDMGRSPVPPEWVRLETNTGGSGGYNAGMRRAIELLDMEAGDGADEYLWLVDSDARVRLDTLARLLEAIEARDDLVAVGAAIADPETGRVFEVGGRVLPGKGIYAPVMRGVVGAPAPPTHGVVECEYVASCCALVRADAVRRVGLMPDLFLNGDDVSWFIRLSQATGMKVGCAPAAVALHPRFDRFATLARYYVARNCLVPLRALGMGFGVRLRRAMHEVIRAAAQEFMGRSDLALLHVRGLADAAAGIQHGPMPGGPPILQKFRPLAELGESLRRVRGPLRLGRAVIDPPDRTGLTEAQDRELRAQIEQAGLACETIPIDGPGAAGAVRRILGGRIADVAVVCARGWVSSWLRGRITVTVTPGAAGGRAGFLIARTGRGRTLARVAARLAQGGAVAMRSARSNHPAPAMPQTVRARELWSAKAAEPGLSVIVVSYNRWETLAETLRRLHSNTELRGAEIIVVDNGSTDGSAERTARQFPGVKLVAWRENIGVGAFNRGVEAAGGDTVLVLDDDAWPDEGAVSRAMEVLAAREDVGAVTLHPRHPRTGRSEWRFADRARPRGDMAWPVMGCGNLVRRKAWLDLGGYDEGFFLYRNDADLALRMLGARTRSGTGVWFNPDWVVWHDSIGARRKSHRWHRLATRNWVWMARRHGRGLGFGGAGGLMLGWIWAHRLAGPRIGSHVQTLLGGLGGLLRRPPATRGGVRENSKGFELLIRLQLGKENQPIRHRRD